MSLNLEGHTLTFVDEFTGSALDTSIWGTRYWWGGRSLPSNGELQYFADAGTAVVQAFPEVDPFSVRANPLKAGDGVLSITARPSPDTSLTDGLPYVSGMINTHGSFAQQYGYFEISARAPAGVGLWPAFWLLPADGAWPPEIDVMEFLGKDPTAYYAGMHWSDPATPGHDHRTEGVAAGVDLTGGFNAFGCLWSEASLIFYLNGVEVCRMETPASLDVPMYLLAGLAVGGAWGGNPDATTAFPAEFQIDYVKVWSRTASGGPIPTHEGTAGDDTLVGTAGGDVMMGRAGDDTLVGGEGADRLDGGEGADAASHVNAAAAVVADLAATDQNSGEAAGDAYVGVENLIGSGFADTLRGDDAANALRGRGGDDRLEGRGGNDVLEGGQGSDRLDGGEGVDAASYAEAGAGVVVDLAARSRNAGDAFGDRHASIENLRGSAFSDSLRGNAKANLLAGSAGNDVLDSGGGNDRLRGGAGTDTLVAGTGRDGLTGGADADVFRFRALRHSGPAESARDTITDFSRLGGDKIDLSGIDGNALLRGDQAFTFLGSAAFDGRAGRLRCEKGADGSSAVVTADANGDRVPDFSLLITVPHALSSGDFML